MYAATASLSIAPLIIQGAIRLSWVRPAMNVCVPQAPKGAVISKRLPGKLRPRRRVRLVLTEVSSINTSGSGCACILGMRHLNHSCRRCFTRTPSRSVASRATYAASGHPLPQTVSIGPLPRDPSSIYSRNRLRSSGDSADDRKHPPNKEGSQIKPNGNPTIQFLRSAL